MNKTEEIKNLKQKIEEMTETLDCATNNQWSQWELDKSRIIAENMANGFRIIELEERIKELEKLENALRGKVHKYQLLIGPTERQNEKLIEILKNFESKIFKMFNDTQDLLDDVMSINQEIAEEKNISSEYVIPEGAGAFLDRNKDEIKAALLILQGDDKSK